MAPVAAVFYGLITAFLLSITVMRHNQAGIYEIWCAWAILLLRMIWKVANWTIEFFVVTSQRILLTSGFLRPEVAILPLAKVTDMSVQRSFMGHLLGYGKVIFESAAGDHELLSVDYFPYPGRFFLKLSGLIFPNGDDAGARAAYQQVIDSGHVNYAPVAAVNLGHLLAAQGDVGGARAAYQQAIDFGHGDLADAAAQSLEALRGPLAEP